MDPDTVTKLVLGYPNTAVYLLVVTMLVSLLAAR